MKPFTIWIPSLFDNYLHPWFHSRWSYIVIFSDIVYQSRWPYSRIRSGLIFVFMNCSITILTQENIRIPFYRIVDTRFRHLAWTCYLHPHCFFPTVKNRFTSKDVYFVLSKYWINPYMSDWNKEQEVLNNSSLVNSEEDELEERFR